MSLQQRDKSAIKDSCVISGNIFSLQLSFLWQTAASGCEGFPTFRELTPSPFPGCAGGLVEPKLWCYQTTSTSWRKNWWLISFGATKPPAHYEDKTDDSSVFVLPNHQHTLKKSWWLIGFGAIKPPAHPEDKTNDSSVLVLPNYQHTLKKNWWLLSFGAIKPPAHPEDGDGVSCRNVLKPSYSDVAVCQRKFHWILSPRKFQGLYFHLLFIKRRW